jgi:VWFA-related protein
MMRTPGVLTLFLIAALGSRPQQVGQNKGAGEAQNFTLTVKSNLVIEAVEVKDKQGKFIHGLTAKDFVLTEDGVPQTISDCEHEDLSETAQPLPTEKTANENVTIYNRLARTEIAPESIENERYKNRRLMALYFDMTALPPSDEMRALSAAQQFVRTQMTTADQIAILRYQGGSVTSCRTLQPTETGY